MPGVTLADVTPASGWSPRPVRPSPDALLPVVLGTVLVLLGTVLLVLDTVLVFPGMVLGVLATPPIIPAMASFAPALLFVPMLLVLD